MDIKISRKVFISALTKVSGLVEKNHAQVALRNVFLQVVDDFLLIRGCDTQAQITTKIPLAIVNKSSTKTVSCFKLLEIVKQLPDGEIHIFLSENTTNLCLEMGESFFNLSTVDADQYPNIDFNDQDITTKITLDETILYTMLSKTAFTMATKEAREYFNATLFHAKDNALNIVTCDSQRLSLIQTQLKIEKECKYVVPRKSIYELIKLLNVQSKTTIDILFTDSLVRIKTESFDFISSLINTRYPNYDPVIPKITETSTKVEAEKKDLKSCCSRVAILSSEAYRGVKVNFDNNVMIFTAKNPAHESAKEILNVKVTNPKKETLSYNIVSFIEAIDFCLSERVELTIVDTKETAPTQNNTVFFHFKDEKCHGFSIIMPIRMNNI